MSSNKYLSNRVNEINPSATMKLNALSKELQKHGKDVISMAVGELDFETPSVISNAGIEAIKAGKTKYTPAAGMLELRQAIIKKYKEEYNLNYSIEEISINSGAKNSLYNVFVSICNPGDEVILPAPYWVSYPEQIKLSNGKPIIIECNDNQEFKMTPEQLRRAITKNTKAVVITSPNNPTGTIYSREELKNLIDVIVDKDILIIYDEIYDYLIFDKKKHVCLPELFPELKDRILVINGHSKVYSMTGWRLGWIVGPKEIIKKVIDFQSHSLGAASTISQIAGTTALSNFTTEFRDILEERRNYIMSRLCAINGISCINPSGAFYMFPNIQKFFGKNHKGRIINNSEEFCSLLLNEKYVVTVPGIAFGLEGYLRLSYGMPMEVIEEALRRIEEFILEIK